MWHSYLHEVCGAKIFLIISHLAIRQAVALGVRRTSHLAQEHLGFPHAKKAKRHIIIYEQNQFVRGPANFLWLCRILRQVPRYEKLIKQGPGVRFHRVFTNYQGRQSTVDRASFMRHSSWQLARVYLPKKLFLLFWRILASSDSLIKSHQSRFFSCPG